MKLKYIDVLKATLQQKSKVTALDTKIDKVVAVDINDKQDTATLKLYGYVADMDDDYDYGDDYFTLQDVDKVLQQLPITVKDVIVEINSYGGDIYTAIAIIGKLDAAIETRGLRVRTHVLGIAASAAGVLALAYPCTVNEHAEIMIHQCMSGAYGNKQDMVKITDLLSRTDDKQIELLARNAKVDKEVIAADLAAETWYNSVTVSEKYNVVVAQSLQNVPVSDYYTRLSAKLDKLRQDDVDTKVAATADDSDKMVIKLPFLRK